MPDVKLSKMALHQWNGASSNIRKFTEEERQELREQFASVSVDYYISVIQFFCHRIFGLVFVWLDWLIRLPVRKFGLSSR